MNVKGQICQDGIWHELTRVASPQPAGKPLISESHPTHCNSPFFEEICQCLDFRQCLQCKNQKVSKLPYQNPHSDRCLPYLIWLRKCLKRPNFYIEKFSPSTSGLTPSLATLFPSFFSSNGPTIGLCNYVDRVDSKNRNRLSMAFTLKIDKIIDSSAAAYLPKRPGKHSFCVILVMRDSRTQCPVWHAHNFGEAKILEFFLVFFCVISPKSHKMSVFLAF